jgi:hypothetical protein
MYVMERINEYTQVVESDAGQPTSALLIADEIDRHDEYRRDLWMGQRGGTWGYKAQVLDHIIDTLHFTPSRSSRLLQAADVSTFLYRTLPWIAHSTRHVVAARGPAQHRSPRSRCRSGAPRAGSGSSASPQRGARLIGDPNFL